MEPVHLAIDVESGDFGPETIIAGVLEAKKVIETPFIAHLCGDQKRIETVLDSLGSEMSSDEYVVEHCPGRISPDDKRAEVWKKSADSSIIRSITLQKEGAVQASISAGDTGILLGAALFILGRKDGVPRPVLAAFLPTVQKVPVLLLDVGANLECRAEHLISFGVIGSLYVSSFFKKDTPRVGLMNIGTEPLKGTRVVKDAARGLEKKCKGYIGFVEGNSVISGSADVIVCDGFVGNVLLKACESIYLMASSIFGKDEKVHELLKNSMKSLNPDDYGAVPFLGIKGKVLKAHGRSSSRAIASAIRTAIISVKRQTI